MLIAIYMQILDMTKAASIVILVVLLTRLLLKRMPKGISYALWAVVLFRLLCPLSIEVPVSIMPEITPTEETYTLADVPITPASAAMAAYRAVGDALNGGLGVQYIRTELPPEDGSTVSVVTSTWWEVWILFGQYIWLAGVAVMASYAVVSAIRLKRHLTTASPLRDNIWLSDEITTPFVMGLIRPKIYLPSSLSEREQSYIILHEQHHIRRLDHIIKALSFIALSVHWFNPLVWAAFLLSGRDMEMSCDEAVVRKMGDDVLADYSASLLSLATGKKIIAGMPLAFGEGDTGSRIRNLARKFAHWKKPAFWVILPTVIVCGVLAVMLLTNPGKNTIDPLDVESVAVNGLLVSAEEQAELIDLLNNYRKSWFPVGGDDPNSLSVATKIHLADGGYYLLHYQYYSGFSFDLRHPGEDDYRSILTHFDANGKATGAWKLAYAFDSAFSRWYRKGNDSMEAVKWTYSPMMSATWHGFFYFHVDQLPDYTHIETSCDYGSLQNLRAEGQPRDTKLRFASGEEICWLPVLDENWEETAENAEITFTVYRDREKLYTGTIEIVRTGTENGQCFYEASLTNTEHLVLQAYSGGMGASIVPMEKDGMYSAIIPGTTYVSYQCIYMNPLSSTLYLGGDTGYKYILGEHSFRTINRGNGTIQNVIGLPVTDTAEASITDSINVPEWQWQEFPYTDEEWAALYIPGIAAMENFSSLHDEILYQPLTDKLFLLRVDGAIWLVELKNNPQMGTYLWSIFSLVPENAMGVAQWENYPILSSRSPVFPFHIDMDHTEISAVCEGGELMEFGYGEGKSASSLTMEAGNPLCWLPSGSANQATIRFTVHNGDDRQYHGTLYVEASSGTNNGRTVYTASLVGTGLHLSPNTEGEGGIISLVEDGYADFTKEYDQ